MKKTTPNLTWAQVCARRLARHGLAQPVSAERLAEQAAEMCGVHAQIASAAEVSLGVRVAGITRQHVRAALWETHSLIKTYGPRGTVHLLAAADLPMWTGALSAVAALRRIPLRDQYLTPEQTELVVAAAADALAEAELTLDELTDAIVQRAGPWAGDRVMPAFQDLWPRWRWAMDTIASRGALCIGPMRGRNVTYANPARWLPGFRPMPGPAALALLVQRYLHAYGPATPQQFAQWLSAPRTWATELFSALGSALELVTLDGSEAYVVAGDTERVELAHRVRLLPYFDAYAVGCHPREKVFPGPAFERALNRGQAGNFPVLLIDGCVAGIWHQRTAGRKLAVTVEAFSPLTAHQRRELEGQVARLGEIQEGTATLTMGKVAVGPHA